MFSVKTHKMQRAHSHPPLWNNHHLLNYLNESLSADVACQEEAIRAGIPGLFVSLLSTKRRSIGKVITLQRSDTLPLINSKVSTTGHCSEVLWVSLSKLHSSKY